MALWPALSAAVLLSPRWPDRRGADANGAPGAPRITIITGQFGSPTKKCSASTFGATARRRVRQKQWLAYQDGDDEAIMVVSLGWYDGHDPKELLAQELIAAVRPLDAGETLVELQSTFTPVAEALELGQTNFGFLAVRVAKSISKHFGGGELRDSEGRSGEKEIFRNSGTLGRLFGPSQSRPVRSAELAASLRPGHTAARSRYDRRYHLFRPHIKSRPPRAGTYAKTVGWAPFNRTRLVCDPSRQAASAALPPSRS